MLTRELALKECVLLWNQLAEEAYQQHITSKEDIPGSWEDYRHNCPCCEYVLSQKDSVDICGREGKFCCSCPMLKQWKYYCENNCIKSGTATYFCIASRSPFQRWSNVIEIRSEEGMLWYDLEFFCYLVAELAEEALSE